MSKIKLSVLSLAILVVGLVSCKKDKIEPTPDPTPSISKTDSLEVQFNSAGSFTLYNFKNGEKVANSDSASTKWDIGFKYVDIIVNSNSSGPGAAGAITQKVDPSKGMTFDLLEKAPATGYAYDTTSTKRAISVDKNLGWYNYNPTTHAFSPKADRFFILKTADGKYVKMEILKVDYLSFNGPTPVTLKYKFRYTYQPDGSVNF